MDSSRVALTPAVVVLSILGLPATNAADAPVEHEYAVEDEQTEMLATEEALETEAIVKSGKHVVHVANNGIDGPTCGARLDPCRSIAQAVTNASDGNVILVGPGRYGDLNGNGALGDIGEEGVPQCPACSCPNCSLVEINKRLRVVSSKGAAATILDAGGLADRGVLIRANGVVFGLPFSGFTVMRAQTGVAVSADRNVFVGGNILRDNDQGMGTTGSFTGGPRWVSPVHFRVIGNLFSANSDQGLSLFGAGHIVRANVASGNGNSGFALGLNGRVTGNVAVANAIGFVLQQANETVLSLNASHGNTGDGVKVELINTGGLLTIQRNNLYGNGNCGLANEAGNANTVVARNNYWGAATGPGFDPADQVCGLPTPSEPFARHEFRIPTPKGW
jgi:hypothetical protein